MIRQGQWEVEMGINIGVMIFDLTALRAQFATHSPVRATLHLNRTGSGTPSLALPLFLYAGNQSGIPAPTLNVSTPATRPVRVSSVFSTTISGGQGSKSFSISTALINSIGNGSSNCLFMDADGSFTNYMSFTGRNDLSRIRLDIEWTPRTTAITAPTALSVSPAISENTAMLSWSGTVAGINNAITGYNIQFSDASNNSTWGAWQDLTTISNTATSGVQLVPASSTRGHFRRFRMQAFGVAGAGFASGWRVSSNSVRRNIFPNAPTAVTASPVIYSDEYVSLVWSGASAGLSPIRGFQIASRTSDGVPTPPDLNITQSFIPIGAANRPARVNDMLYVSIHETDNTSAGANARGHAYYLNDPSTTVSWHYTVDDTETVQHLPENEDAFHAGDGAGSGNRHSIGIEICVNEDGDFAKAVQRAIELTADICNRRNIPIANVVQHNHWSGKNCPRNIRAGVPFGWETFLHKVAEATAGDIVWSNWTVLAVIDRAATSGTFTTSNVSRVPETYTQFGVWTIDTLGAFSSESLSNSIRNIAPDRPPLAPIIDAPRNVGSGSNINITYNTKPMFFIRTQPEPDGQLQTLFVQINNGVWHNSVDNPEYFSTSGEFDGVVRTIYTSDTLPTGSHTITAHVSDGGGGASSGGSGAGSGSGIQPRGTGGGFDSPVVTRHFTILPSPFDTIASNQTAAKARHITDLRTAINNNRKYYGLSAYSWDGEITPQVTPVIYFPFHILELRAAIQPVIDWVNDYDPQAAAQGVLPLLEILPLDWQNIGTRRPRAAVMNQLMDFVLRL